MPEMKVEKSQRSSIGSKLLLIYLLLVVLAVFSAGVAWFGFDSIDESHRKVVDESAPMMIEAYRLSELVTNLVNLEANLSLSSDQADLERMKSQVNALAQSIEAEMSLLGQYGFDQSELLDIEKILTKLKANTVLQNELISQRIEKKQLNEKLQQQALAEVVEFTISLKPVSATLQFSETESDRQLFDTVNELKRNAVYLEKILTELPFVNSSERLLSLKNEYKLNLNQITSNLSRIQSLELRKEVALEVRPLMQQLDAENEGLFASVLSEISLQQQIAQKNEINTMLSSQLTQNIAATIRFANQTIQTDYEQAAKARNNAQLLLLMIVVLLAVIPLLILIFYLRPKVLQRLEALADATLNIASGDLKTSIDISGRDELSAMAQALSQFQADLVLKQKAEEELNKTLLQLQVQKKALDQFAIVVETDARGRIIYANSQFCKVSGYTQDELIGQDHRDIVNSGYHSKSFWKELWGTIQDNRIWRGDVCNRTKEHEIYWVDTTIVPICDHGVRPTRFLGIRFVITDRKQAEDALKVSQERYELAVKGSTVGLWDWDLVTSELYWSPRFKEILGVSEEGFIPRLNQFEDRLHPEDCDRIVKALREHIEHAKPYDVEYRLRREDNSYIWVHARGQAIWDKQGHALRMAGSVDDISIRKKAELKLKHHQEELQIILNSVPSLIWFKDTENNILRLNQAAANAMNKTMSEVEGRPSNAFFPDELAEAYHRDDLQVIESMNSKLGIIEQYPLPSGQMGWLSTDKVPYVNPSGETQGVIVIATDITQVKRAEEELAASNEELEQFAYIASHDLQEPLRTISGYVQLIDERYTDVLDKEGKEFMAFVVDGAQRMKALIHDLLKYSRAGKIEVELEHTDLNKTVQDVLALLELEIKEKEAQITLDHLPTLMTDKTQISQLFQNFITNALKFQKEGKSPKIHIHYKETRDPNNDACHQFAIEDNGIGVKPEYFDKIFLIFQRLNKRGKYPGTGIGLAICKKIVERYDGHIWVESELGKGTTFYFTIKK